jgi:hypothetical protein
MDDFASPTSTLNVLAISRIWDQPRRRKEEEEEEYN